MAPGPAHDLLDAHRPGLGDLLVALGAVLVDHLPPREHQAEGDVGVLGQGIVAPAAHAEQRLAPHPADGAAILGDESQIHAGLLVHLVAAGALEVEQSGEERSAHVDRHHPAHDRADLGIEERRHQLLDEPAAREIIRVEDEVDPGIGARLLRAMLERRRLAGAPAGAVERRDPAGEAQGVVVHDLPGGIGGAVSAVDGERDGPRGVAAVRARHAPAEKGDGSRDLRRVLLGDGEEVGVGDLLLRVGQGDRLAVERVELLALDLVAQLLELLLEATPPGQLADRQLASGKTYRLRGHDLVGERVLNDAVLVDARFVGEGVAADDRLVRLNGEPGQVADQPARRGDLLGLDAAA